MFTEIYLGMWHVAEKYLTRVTCLDIGRLVYRHVYGHVYSHGIYRPDGEAAASTESHDDDDGDLVPFRGHHAATCLNTHV